MSDARPHSLLIHDRGGAQRRSAFVVALARALDPRRARHPAGLALRPGPHPPPARRRRLLLPQCGQPPGRGQRFHQPLHLPLDPPAPGRADSALAAALRVRAGHPVSDRVEDLLGAPGLVLHHRGGGHRRLRLRRARDRRATGGARRRLHGRRLSQHLDERRARALRSPGSSCSSAPSCFWPTASGRSRG